MTIRKLLCATVLLAVFSPTVAVPARAQSDAPRKTLAGNWIVVFLNQDGTDFPVWLVEIKKNARGAYQARLIETMKGFGGASTLKEFSISDQEARLVFDSSGNAFDFQGRLQKGAVRGTIAVKQSIRTALLMATDAASLKDYPEDMPSEGQQEYIKAVSAAEPFEPLRRFATQFGESPLALDAYANMLALAKTANLDEPAVRKLADSFMQTAKIWGPRIEMRVNIDIGLTLSSTDTFPELALAYLNSAERRLTDATPDRWRELLYTEKGKRLLLSGNDAEGAALLRKVRQTNPFNAEVAWLLAQNAEKSKKADEALSLYATLASIPTLERSLQQMLMSGGSRLSRDDLPSRAVARIWKEQKGDAAGLPEYLDKAYEASLRAIAGPRQPARKSSEGTRVVLCELFTGAMCPPCTAADIATSALEAAYGQSEVVVLRYHEHIPGPDPLANEETQERYDSYAPRGTPAMYINGRSVDGPGGPVSLVPEIFGRVKEMVQPYLTEKIDVKVELSAKASGGKIAITAKATGLKKFPDEVKLRLVLAEDKIAYNASNGIRMHEMVVRTMPGGADGIDPENGQLSYSGQIDIAQLRSQLSAYLTKTETQMAIAFDDKPLDLAALHLVGFLQHDETEEVLQAAAIPVTGTLTPAGAEAQPATKAARAKAPTEARKR